MGRLQADLTDSISFVVIPVEAGIQFSSSGPWIPVFMGMTILMYCSDTHGRPHSNPMKDMSPRVGRLFRKVYTSPEGEGFPSSPKEILNYPCERGNTANNSNYAPA